MAWVYILHAAAHNKYYVGFSTIDPQERLERHNQGYYEDKFTSRYKPWILFFSIKCNSDIQARSIEKYIKSMKSSVYINNLKQYPEMSAKLLERFKS